jgi:hypothetical protein
MAPSELIVNAKRLQRLYCSRVEALCYCSVCVADSAACASPTVHTAGRACSTTSCTAQQYQCYIFTVSSIVRRQEQLTRSLYTMAIAFHQQPTSVIALQQHCLSIMQVPALPTMSTYNVACE